MELAGTKKTVAGAHRRGGTFYLFFFSNGEYGLHEECFGSFSFLPPWKEEGECRMGGVSVEDLWMKLTILPTVDMSGIICTEIACSHGCFYYARRKKKLSLPLSVDIFEQVCAA